MDTVNQGLQKADPVFQSVKQNVQSNTGLYIGIGGAILGVGAIIIGGITYYTNKGAHVGWHDLTQQSDFEKSSAFEQPISIPMFRPQPSLVDEEKTQILMLTAAHNKYAVGKYNENYPGWSKMTAADWMNPAIQAALVHAHRERGGWTLLKEPFINNYPLCVAEGRVRIDNALVVKVGYNGGQQLHDVYSAMNFNTKVPWTTTAPVLDNTWTVVNNEIDKLKESNPPCLFIKQESIKQESGGKKTRRRKSKSRRTRKH